MAPCSSIMRDNTQAFESLAAFRGASYNLGDVIKPERLDGVEATGEFFAPRGRAGDRPLLRARERDTGIDHVAMLSDACGGDVSVPIRRSSAVSSP